MKPRQQQVKALQEIIIQSKDPFLIKHWKREIELLNNQMNEKHT